MGSRRVVIAAIAIAAAASWTIATPALSIPIGTSVTVGDSMGSDQPHFAVYSDHREPEVGDKILFESGQTDGMVLHRVVDETEHGWQTKGDGNDHPDQMGEIEFVNYATPENTAGVVVLRVPLFATLLGLIGTAGLVYRRSLQAAAVAVLRPTNSHT